MSEPIIRVEPASTEYLYGVTPLHFKEFKYKDILIEKIKLGNKMASELFKAQRECNDSERSLSIEEHLNNVYRAVEHNEKLLKEFERYEKETN